MNQIREQTEDVDNCLQGYRNRKKKRESVVCPCPRHATDPAKPSRMRVIVARARAPRRPQQRSSTAAAASSACPGWLLRPHFIVSLPLFLPSPLLPETGIHDHGVPLGATEQILDVDVVEVLLLLHAIERRLLLMGPAVRHPAHVRLLLLLLLLR
jgi:hypothetical protein